MTTSKEQGKLKQIEDFLGTIMKEIIELKRQTSHVWWLPKLTELPYQNVKEVARNST